MNYIVLDLEWNHSKEIGNKAFPFEIIEIGAIKLDEDRNVISQFSELIKPQVYTELNDIIQEIVNLDEKDLEKKDSFPNVIRRFFEWCGNDYVFCTWGDMDLTELQRNLVYFNINGYIDKPIIYYDIQKIFALSYFGKKEAHSLENVIDYLGVNKDRNFHRALSDAMYTTRIMKKIDIEFIKKYYSIDCFHNPKTKDETILAIYDTYSKYISYECDTKEEIMEDENIKKVVCFKCGKVASKKVKWFCSNVKVYCCIAECKEHGLLQSKVRIKKTINGRVYAIKTVRQTDEKGYKLVRDRQTCIRAKRKEKRGRKNKKIGEDS